MKRKREKNHATKNVYVNFVWMSISHLSVQFMSYAWFRYLKSHQFCSARVRLFLKAFWWYECGGKKTAITFLAKWNTQLNLLMQTFLFNLEWYNIPLFRRLVFHRSILQWTILELARIFWKNHRNRFVMSTIFFGIFWLFLAIENDFELGGLMRKM